jgi:poly-gamma-glutamate capsule biosynthesis protein CapA/YwtB (metallophosphatase superfamily)
MSISRSERMQSEKQRRRRKQRGAFRISAIILFILAVASVIWWLLQDDGAQGSTGSEKAAPPPIEKAKDVPAEAGKAGSSTAVPASPAPAASSVPVPSPSPSTGNVGAPVTPGAPSVKLAFVGDVIWASTVETRLKENGFDYPYKNVKEILQKPDITVANLETPITTRGEAQDKKYAYRSMPEGLPAFKEAGFDIVNLANNHILDYGLEGLMDTFGHLDRAGIKRIGAGRNVKEAFQPVIMEKNGIKIAFLGFSKVVPHTSWKAGPDSAGVADTYATKLPVEAIKRARQSADLVIVIAHWGKEQEPKPEQYQIDFAKEYIDAGADLVVGSHAHVLQGFEQYKGKWIAYGLGNFIFTMNPKPETWDSAILEAACDNKGACALNVVPILTKLANPEPMSAEAGAKLFERLTSLSRGAEVRQDGVVQAATGR